MFEVGQKIICIEMPHDYFNKLEIGRVYTLFEKDDTWLTVKENDARDCYEEKYFIAFNKCKLTNLIFNIKPKLEDYGF